MKLNITQSIIDDLINENEVFKHIFIEFQDVNSLSLSDKLEAQRIFKFKYPSYDFNYSIVEWLTEQLQRELNPSDELTDEIGISSICPRMVYDPLKRKYSEPSILPPHKRAKKEEFDVYQFILKKQQSNEEYQLTMQCKTFEDDLDEFLHQNQARNILKADRTLRKAAGIIILLNGTCKYRMLELQSEKRIQ